MRVKRHWPALLGLVALLMTAIFPVSAQDANTCDVFLDQVVSQLATNCANTDDNSICFGFNRMQAAFVEPVEPPIEFVEPGDRADLNKLLSVATTPYSPQIGEWGVAYVRGQANLARALAKDDAVVYFIVGDTLVFNEAVGDSALILPEDPINVTVAAASDLLSFPPDFGDRTSKIVGNAAAGAVLRADAVTIDREWVRVAYLYQDTPISRRSTAWLPVESLETVDLSALSPMGPGSMTELQKFSFISSELLPNCSNLPLSEVLVQSPGNVEADLFVNGLNTRIFSTVIFRIVDINTTNNTASMRVIPLVGNAYLPDPEALDDFPRGIVIPAGRFIDVPVLLDEETGKYGLDPEFYEGFADFKETYDDEAARGLWQIDERIIIRLLAYERLPENLLNYIMEIIKIIRASGVGGVVPIFEGGVKPPLIFDLND